MKRNLRTIVIAALLIVFCGSLVCAQDREQLQKQRRERDLRETIKVYMYYKMKESLNLSKEQEEKVISKVEEMELMRQKFMDDRKALLQDLETMLQDPKTSDEAFAGEITLFKRMEESHRKDEETVLAQINEILNPRQRAQFLIFMVDFRRELQAKIDNVRRMQEEEQMRRRRGMEQNPRQGDDE